MYSKVAKNFHSEIPFMHSSTTLIIKKSHLEIYTNNNLKSLIVYLFHKKTIKNKSTTDNIQTKRIPITILLIELSYFFCTSKET